MPFDNPSGGNDEYFQYPPKPPSIWETIVDGMETLVLISLLILILLLSPEVLEDGHAE